MPKDSLERDESLSPDQSRRSGNGCFNFVYQADGNLVLYHKLGVPLWASNTPGRPGDTCIMQADGNLVIYSDGTPIWASDTPGNGPSRLVVQDDGNVVIYRSSDGAPTWATCTDYPGMPVPANLCNALAGIIEGLLWENLSTRTFHAESSQTHDIRVAGVVVGSYTEEQSFEGGATSLDLDIPEIKVYVLATAVVVKASIASDITGEVRCRIRHLGSVTSNARARITIDAKVKADVNFSAKQWKAEVADLSGRVERLSFSNDGVNPFRGYIQDAINNNIDADDLRARLNTGFGQANQVAQFPQWVSMVAKYLCV